MAVPEAVVEVEVIVPVLALALVAVVFEPFVQLADHACSLEGVNVAPVIAPGVAVES